MASRLQPDTGSLAETIAKKYFPCTCGEIYLSRKLTAPDCPYHANDWESAMEEYKNQFTPQSAPVSDVWVEKLVSEHGIPTIPSRYHCFTSDGYKMMFNFTGSVDSKIAFKEQVYSWLEFKK